MMVYLYRARGWGWYATTSLVTAEKRLRKGRRVLQVDIQALTVEEIKLPSY